MREVIVSAPPTQTGSPGDEGKREDLAEAAKGDAQYLAGRHALVTGGAKGIGAAISLELARLGANLSLLGRDAAALSDHAARIEAEHGVRAEGIRCDVSEEDQVEAAVAEATRAFGTVYVLVNNAGVSGPGRVHETDRATWDRMLAVNLTGAFLMCRAVLPFMLKAGGGRIVNIASTSALKAYKGIAAYIASKHGLIGLTRAAALETAKHGITVNAVCPGYTDTPMARVAIENVMARTGKSADEARRAVVGTMPRERIVTPAEVASTVAWLCSPDAAAVTGQSIVVAGGEVM